MKVGANQVSNFLSRYSDSKDYCFGEDIPSKKLQGAYMGFPIPRDASILALVDSTLFGSNETGLAVTEQGIYWKNDWTQKSLKTKLSWEDFILCKVRKYDRYSVELGNGNYLNLSGCSFGVDNMVLFLSELQKSVQELQGSANQTERKTSTVPPPPPKEEWMISVDGVMQGPLDKLAIKNMLFNREIMIEDSFVWKEGMENWVPMNEVESLACLLKKGPPPPPPMVKR